MAWTPERRARQAAAIHAWRPWERSTGPRSIKGKASSSRNADKGGHRQLLRDIARAIRQARDSLQTISP